MRARARTACTLAPGGSTRDSYAAKGRSANLTSEPREPRIRPRKVERLTVTRKYAESLRNTKHFSIWNCSVRHMAAMVELPASRAPGRANGASGP